MLKEFKEFIAQGDVVSMAVGIIIGGAFTAIVNALVNNILGPILGVILGGIDFSGLAIDVGAAHIEYGLFIQAVINFLIVGFVIFLIVKALAAVKLTAPIAEEEETEKEEVRTEITVLEEILTELKSENSSKHSSTD